MTDAVTSLIKYFDRKRDDFYKERKTCVRQNIRFMSDKRALSLEKEFADRFIANIDKGLASHEALPDSANWHGVILHLKNEIEGVGYSVDYLNYYHTFLAAFLAVSSAFAFKFHDFGAIIMAIVAGGFIIFAFTERTKQRNKILKNKTLLNILEYYKAIAQSSSK